ncbi:MAG: hypothetical protein IRZ32_00120 [Solirubrobacteraceae bacterium]|nr:hypothetical protein [Solirubrobacteraceae bacterium]
MSAPEDERRDALARGYARGRARDEEIRAALVPLERGERTTALTVAVAVAVLLAIGVVAGALTTEDLREKGGTVPFGIFLAAVLLACAWGMWRTSYWAVLAFEAFLWFQVVMAALALVVASSWAAAAVCVAVIGLSGWLAWKLIRVMARIQARERTPPPGDPAP